MEENWVVFPSELDGAFCIFSVNAGFGDVAPLESHPICHWVIINYGQKGFPSAEINAQFNDFEDALTAFLEERKGAYVGRLTSEKGNRQLFFYHPKNIMDELQEFVRDQQLPFDVEMNRKEDPEWELYFGLLYPSPRDWQRIQIHQVLQNLRKYGDRHDIPRNIDHYAYFDTEASAKAFEEFLESRKFSTIELNENDGIWNISFKQFTAVEIPVIEPVILTLFEKAQQLGGEYDGWGSPITKMPEN